MFYGATVLLFLLGVLGAASLIIAKKPDAKDLIDKLAPYQGWIGVSGVFYGAWWVISAVLNMGLLAHFPIYWITWIATGAVLLGLGLLLGVGTMKTFVKNPEAVARLDQTVLKLAPYQGTFGIVALGLAAWSLVSYFMFAHG